MATNSGEPVQHTSLWVSEHFALKSFRMAAATVTYAILSIASLQNRQIADIQMEGILYEKTACLEPIRSEWLIYHYLE